MKSINKKLLISLITLSFLASCASNASSSKYSFSSSDIKNGGERIEQSTELIIVAKACFQNAEGLENASYSEKRSIERSDTSNNDSVKGSGTSPFRDSNHLVYSFSDFYFEESTLLKFDLSKVSDRFAYNELASTIGEGEFQLIYGEIVFDGSFREHYAALKGESGYYCVLANGGAPNGIIFSSHKTVSEEGVDKLFLPPFYGVYLDITQNKFNFARNDESIVTYNDFAQDTFLGSIESPHSVPKSETFSLSEFPYL